MELSEVSLELPLGLQFLAIPGYGCYVNAVVEGGNADKSGKLPADTRIVAVNEVLADGKPIGELKAHFHQNTPTGKLVLSVGTDAAGCAKFREVQQTKMTCECELPLGLAIDGDSDGYYVLGLKEGGNATQTGMLLDHTVLAFFFWHTLSRVFSSVQFSSACTLLGVA